MSDRCAGYEQHPETGMIRRCTLAAGHAGRHEHHAMPGSVGPFPQEPAPGSPEATSRAALDIARLRDRLESGVDASEVLAVEQAARVIRRYGLTASGGIRLLEDSDPEEEAIFARMEDLLAARHDAEAWERTAKLTSDKAAGLLAEVERLRADVLCQRKICALTGVGDALADALSTMHAAHMLTHESGEECLCQDWNAGRSALRAAGRLPKGESDGKF